MNKAAIVSIADLFLRYSCGPEIASPFSHWRPFRSACHQFLSENQRKLQNGA
jgi:hypothetical protein